MHIYFPCLQREGSRSSLYIEAASLLRLDYPKSSVYSACRHPSDIDIYLTSSFYSSQRFSLAFSNSNQYSKDLVVAHNFLIEAHLLQAHLLIQTLQLRYHLLLYHSESHSMSSLLLLPTPFISPLLLHTTPRPPLAIPKYPQKNSLSHVITSD